jgi:uncharacterized protein YpmB
MRRAVSIILIFAFTIVFSGADFSYAQTETVDSVAAAKDIAAKAGGSFVEGKNVPAVAEGEVALPVLDESSGEIIGYIVADKEKLLATLNSEGLTEIAQALAASEAGAAAGGAVGAGIFGGTTGTVLLIAAAVGGVALAVGSGGGGSSTTSHH